MKNKKSTIIAWTIMISLCCGYWVWADLTSHTEALLDALILSLDPNADGSTADATVPVTALEIGHASDTTLSRAAAGQLAVEGSNLIRESDVDDTPVDAATAAPVSSNWAYDQTHWVITPADGTIQGGIYKAGTAGASIAQFDLLYKDPTTLKYSPFIAATGTKISGVDIPFAMAMAAASADDPITVVTGDFYVYNTGWSGLGNIGNAQIYPSTATAGGITATLSTTTGDLVCVVGVGESGSKVHFRLPATPSIEVP